MPTIRGAATAGITRENPEFPAGRSEAADTFGVDNGATMTGARTGERPDSRHGNEVLNGEGGDDKLIGADGDGTLNGGDCNDESGGGGGNDALNGGTGGDERAGGPGMDALNGESGAGTPIARSGGNALDGEAGRDSPWGGSGGDALRGGSGVDALKGGTGAGEFMFTEADGGCDHRLREWNGQDQDRPGRHRLCGASRRRGCRGCWRDGRRCPGFRGRFRIDHP